MKHCHFNDCGYCYAKAGMVRNEGADGKCLGYRDCTYYNSLNKDSETLCTKVVEPVANTKKEKPMMNAVVMDAEWRKQRPVYSGFLKYFPRSIKEVSHASWVGNEQHNPGAELHWDRSKSGDELDALVRHLMDMKGVLDKDTDGVYHFAKAIWRLHAAFEKALEQEQ